MTTEQLDNIDTRLAQLLQATGELVISTRQQKESVDSLVESSRQQKESIDSLVESSRQQKESIDKMKESIDRLASILIPMTRTIETLSQNSTRLLDAAQRSAQASEAAALIAQSNQNAMRDLIEQLRQQN